MSFLISFVGAILCLIIAYLLGSISFAVIVSKLMGLSDPRSFGSGNPGATNVLRSGNKKAAIFTLIGDMAKGWLAVYLASLAIQLNILPSIALPLAAIGAFLGHLFPIFLKFKGGKGVATGLGVLLGIQIWLAIAVLITWLLVAVFTRYSSLAAIMAAIFAPFYYILGDRVLWHTQPSITLVIVIISVLLLARHKQNISRLLKGKESKIGSRKK